MLKLSWQQLNDQNFVQAMMELNNNNKLDRTTAYRVGRIVDTSRREMEKARAIELNLRKKYVKLDEKGEPLLDEKTKQPTWNSPLEETRKQFAAEFTKVLAEHFVEIKVHKLPFASLEGLSGAELIAIEHIVDGLPEEA